MSKDRTLPDVQPSATMSEEDLEAWASLPANEQLERLRRAIDKGAASGVSSKSMDDIWNDSSKRNPDAKL